MKVIKSSNVYWAFRWHSTCGISQLLLLHIREWAVEQGRRTPLLSPVSPPPRLPLSNFMLSSGQWLQTGSFPVPLLPRGSALFFTGLFLSPQLSVGVSRAWGTHRKGDLQGDFDWAWAAWYLSLGQGLPRCALPLLPGRGSSGEAYWCQQLLGSAGGTSTLDLAPCTSKSVHLDPWPGDSDWVLCHRARAAIFNQWCSLNLAITQTLSSKITELEKQLAEIRILVNDFNETIICKQLILSVSLL